MNTNEATIEDILKLWDDYHKRKDSELKHLRFGQYAINQLGWTNPSIFYEPDSKRAFEKLLKYVLLGGNKHV